MTRKLIVSAVLIAVFSSGFLYSESTAGDQIMMADIPFVYGENEFIRRIEARTEGREPVGLVLSGGSARAFAHIGVLKRMEEIGFVPDFIVTNSMGSIVGLLYAAGFSPDQITEIILSTDIAGLFRVAAPLKGGIIDVSRFSGLLSLYTGSLDVKELPIPIMVLCEDLITKRQVRIAEGDFLRVMQAAYALPVYFDPVEYEGHLLIDGGISNLVPLDTAYEYTDKVIASTAFYQNPKLNLKNPVTNLNVALDVGKSRTGIIQIKQYEPLLIRCDVESFSFMEFGSLREIQAAGYASADQSSALLMQLDGSPVTEEISGLREEHAAVIEKAVKKYRYLESLPVVEPALLLTTGLEIFNTTKSLVYYNTDIHLNAGLDFSYSYFNAAAALGAGFDTTAGGGLFPVFDASAGVDLFQSLRLFCLYSLRFEPAGFSEPEEPSDLFRSSGFHAALRYVPLAGEHLRFGIAGTAEAALKGLNSLEDTMISFRTEFSAESAPRSEDNYGVMLDTGLEFAETTGVFSFDKPAFFADSSVMLPVPGTGGLFRLDARGFSRQPLAGQASFYYSRDGMKATVAPGEYSRTDFVEADLVFNPYGFRPAAAELFMFKEIELAVFGSIGRFDQFVWSSGLSLDFDISLIGLKPLTLSGWAGWDSLSEAISGGITIIP